MASLPKTQYAKSGDLHIAYQVTGSGPLDLVWIPGFVSHLESSWEHPWPRRFLERLSAFSRLIRFDKRGTGLSDRVGGIPTLEERMDDVRAVMDAAGSERAALLGVSEGGPMSILFAATYPERTTALALYASYARRSWAPDHPFGHTEEEWARAIAAIEGTWGDPAGIDVRAPGAAEDVSYRQWWATFQRLAASPGAAVAVMEMNKEIDVRPVLATIHVPTLVLHRKGDPVVRVEQGRYLAAHIPGARLVEFPGADHTPWVGDMDSIVNEVECEVIGDKVGGIAVHIGARVAGLAGPGEVLVSGTVKDLVAGSGIRFEERGVHTLKGVPGEWRLFAASSIG